ncbi:MAG: hypothetical protein MJZ34_03180 [Paludibacteraceae bacterium]|nr:hypothetical protein [Paludibacteraceae bacterium]
MKVLKWIWQFPQNLVGFCLTRKPKAVEDYKDVKVYFTNNVFGCGVSLGDYIVLDESYLHAGSKETDIKHEYGHHKQSMYLGWLYLIVVGIWSAARNRLDVWGHKDWSAQKKIEWYYSSFPENWADKLGGVDQLAERGIENKDSKVA